MNPTLMFAFWRQRLASPVRVVILAALVFVPLLLVVFVRGIGFRALGDAFALAMVFAVGMIGHDVSTGVLQLLFARPVRRWEYVTSRWLAVAAGAGAVSLSQVLLAWMLMSLRGADPGLEAVADFAVGRLFEVFGVAAVMTLLSSLVGGYGDLALYAMLSIGSGIAIMVGQATGSDVTLWIAGQVSAFLTPRVEPAHLAGAAFSGHAVVSYLSTVSICLLLAVASVNRKELSYASA